MSFQSIAWQLMSEEDYGAYIEERLHTCRNCAEPHDKCECGYCQSCGAFHNWAAYPDGYCPSCSDEEQP